MLKLTTLTDVVVVVVDVVELEELLTEVVAVLVVVVGELVVVLVGTELVVVELPTLVVLLPTVVVVGTLVVPVLVVGVLVVVEAAELVELDGVVDEDVDAAVVVLELDGFVGWLLQARSRTPRTIAAAAAVRSVVMKPRTRSRRR